MWAAAPCYPSPFMRAILPVLAALGAAGCGYVGEPLPPLANVPARVTDLTVVQHGSHIVARFTVPKATTEGAVLKSTPALDLRIGPGSNPFVPAAWVESATQVPEGPVTNGVARYEIPAAAWIGKQAILGVRVTGANGKSSVWSNLVTVPVIAPLETPMEVSAVATAQGVQLTWRGGGTSFRMFRRTGTQPFAAVADVAQPPWTDPTSVFGTAYTYQVQAIAKLGDKQEAESELSAEVPITPIDTFPPAVPTGLHATAAGDSVELSWEGSTEADLAGYRVYRAAPGGGFEKIADPVLPAYSDHAVEHGKTYRYAVTSVDQSGNESGRSAVAEIALE